jgi:hypothetical protein
MSLGSDYLKQKSQQSTTSRPQPRFLRMVRSFTQPRTILYDNIRLAVAQIQICTTKPPIHTDLSHLAASVTPIQFNRLITSFGP